MEALHQTDLERLRPVLARYGLEGTAVFPILSILHDCTAYRIQTNAGDVFLKEIPKQQVGLESLERRLQQLRSSQYKAIPHFYTTPSERIVTVFGLRKYIVAEWVNGTPLSLVRTLENYQELGRSLADLHKIPAPGRIPVRNGNEQRILSMLGPHGREILRKGRAHYYLARALRSPVLTHAALSPENVIVQNGRVVLVNWDRVEPGCSYIEVARGLMNMTDGNIESMQALLTGYEEVKPFVPEERQLIFAFFSFPVAARHMMRKAAQKQSSKQLYEPHQEAAHRQRAWEWLESWAAR